MIMNALSSSNIDAVMTKIPARKCRFNPCSGVVKPIKITPFGLLICLFPFPVFHASVRTRVQQTPYFSKLVHFKVCGILQLCNSDCCCRNFQRDYCLNCSIVEIFANCIDQIVCKLFLSCSNKVGKCYESHFSEAFDARWFDYMHAGPNSLIYVLHFHCLSHCDMPMQICRVHYSNDTIRFNMPKSFDRVECYYKWHALRHCTQ